MHAQRPQSVFGGLDSLDALVGADIPELDLAAPATAHQLALPTALDVHVSDPVLVLLPHLNHGTGRFMALVKDTNGPITIAGDEKVALNLIRRQ